MSFDKYDIPKQQKMQQYSENFSGCGIFEMSGYSHEPGWCHPGEMRILAAKVSLISFG